MNRPDVSRITLLLYASSVLLAISASAQEPSPGDRVRVTFVCDTRLLATFSSASSDSVSIVIGGSLERTVPLESIKTPEVSIGKRRNTLRGLGIGAAFGGLTLGATSLVSNTDG